jgi:hypothetical protein
MSGIRDSIVMTVSDREPELLMSTVRWLRMSDLDDTEILIVDDCSRLDYSFYKPVLDICNARLIRLEPYECYQVEGENYNNPAKAFNRGLAEAQGSRVILMSSDVLAPPRALHMARQFDPTEAIYCPRVVDLATQAEYCGLSRIFPMPWFLSCSADHARKCGGWDENYLGGLCWEDNDFVGRLALTTGKILYDFDSIVWHQSHQQPAYWDEPVVVEANKRNRKYTLDKWTSLPFGDSDKIAFESKRVRHETGHLMFEYHDFRELLPMLVAKTNSPFVTVAA